MNVYDKVPVVHNEAFVAPSASLMGEVRVGQGSAIWYGCVLRGIYINQTSLLFYDVYCCCCCRRHIFLLFFVLFSKYLVVVIVLLLQDVAYTISISLIISFSQ